MVAVMPTVILVRHGRSTANAEKVLAGRLPGVALDETGRDQAAALAALRDPAHREAVREHTLEHRSALVRLLQEAGYVVVPSQANFVLVEAPEERDLVDRLTAHGVSVRPGSSLGAPGTVRISVPSARGLELLRDALAEPR